MGYSALRVVSSSSDETVGARLLSFASDNVDVANAVSLPAIEGQTYTFTDIVLIDLDLVDGLGAVQRICRRLNAPIVIVIAGKGHKAHTLEYTLTLAELRGASVVFPKPVSVDELVEAALAVLARRLGVPVEHNPSVLTARVNASLGYSI